MDLTLPILFSPIDDASGCTLASTFIEQTLSLEEYNGLFITPRIDAQNFRHRISKVNYFSDWHVAGDATLIIVRAGTLQIGLRNGEYRNFSAGELFVAKDCLQEGEAFDAERHGHTARVIGEKELLAVHIKLSAAK